MYKNVDVYGRKPERSGNVSNWTSTTVDMLRRKVQNLEEENVNLKVLSFRFNTSNNK